MSFFDELSEEFKKIDHQKYHHGHLYYICGVITMTLFFATIVQAVIMHVNDWLGIALLEYFLSTMLLLTTWRCFHRGHGHYKYPPHK
jgi:hypothetical protein